MGRETTYHSECRCGGSHGNTTGGFEVMLDAVLSALPDHKQTVCVWCVYVVCVCGVCVCVCGVYVFSFSI